METINEITHSSGMAYWIDESKERQWSSLEMVAQLQDADMVKVVQGIDGRSSGLVGCCISQRPKSYDHKTHHKLRVLGYEQPHEKLAIWDFELMRDDGTGIRLHPSWKGTKVETFHMEGHAIEVQPPAKGLGRSEGPGTYARYKGEGNSMTIRFDPRKWQETSG